MSRGKRVPFEVKSFIAEVAESQPTWQTWQLRKYAERHFDGKGLHVPGPDSVRKIAKTARAFKEKEDEPWSIGVSGLDIGPDAVKDVLAIWNRTFIVGASFTVRQARWVSRLRGVVSGHTEDERIKKLGEWASLYAGREKAQTALEKPADTSDMDAVLAFTEERYRSLIDTGRIREFDIFGRAEALSWVAPSPSMEISEEWDSSRDDAVVFIEINSILEHRPGLGQEASDVFRIWGEALQRGVQGWARIERSRRYGFLVKLVNEVESHFEQERRLEILEGNAGLRSKRRTFFPSIELLDDAGYAVDANG